MIARTLKLHVPIEIDEHTVVLALAAVVAPAPARQVVTSNFNSCSYITASATSSTSSSEKCTTVRSAVSIPAVIAAWGCQAQS
jgi:hypothetical protein